METDNPNYYNFVFDGSNFRGYHSESELVAKAYANNWAAAITSDVQKAYSRGGGKVQDSSSQFFSAL